MVGLSFKGPTYWCHGRTCFKSVFEEWYVLSTVNFNFLNSLISPSKHTKWQPHDHHIFWVSCTNLRVSTIGISNAHKEDIWPGSWIAESRWPSPNVQCQEFILQNDRGLVLALDNQGQHTCNKPIESEVSVKSSFLSGSWSGLPLASSIEDLPVEQRLEDALSECWESATLEEPVALLGFAELHLQLRCDRPCALVAARLCDVFPTGESSLITRGMSTHQGPTKIL